MQKRVVTVFLSFVFAILVLICGVWFINVKTVFSMVLLSAMMVALFFLYSPFTKAITLPEGYTLFQALAFYQNCLSIEVNSFDKIKINYELLQEFLQEKGILADLDEDALWKLYCDGKVINDIITFNKNNDQESEDYK